MITGSQCRAGRALVEISRGKLARRSGVDETIIEQFEHKLDTPRSEQLSAIEATLEELGLVFLQENGGGIGVRLKFTNADARQIARMERGRDYRK